MAKTIPLIDSFQRYQMHLSKVNSSRVFLDQMKVLNCLTKVRVTLNPKFTNKLDDLGVPPVLKDIIMSKRGLLLVVGGTGSGKSTTLAGMIGHRNENSYGHIITIEDPVEYTHPHKNCIVTQREVGVDTRS